jgi:hypothetical protein
MALLLLFPVMTIRHARLAAFLLLVAASLPSQTPSRKTTQPAQPKPDAGTFVNNVYTNPYIGFSYTAPGDGWTSVPQDEKAKQAELPGQFQLLRAFVRTDTRQQVLQLRADDASFYHPRITLEAWFKGVTHHVASLKEIQIIKDPYAVEYAGLHFYRADYKQNYGGQLVYGSIFGTEHNGFMLNWIFVATAEETLKELADSLGTLSFVHARN